jgi:hypothetical protein
LANLRGSRKYSKLLMKSAHSSHGSSRHDKLPKLASFESIKASPLGKSTTTTTTIIQTNNPCLDPTAYTLRVHSHSDI